MRLRTWINNNGGAGKVSKRLGITRFTIYYWLNGSTVPRPRTLKKLLRMAKGQLQVTDFYKTLG